MPEDRTPPAGETWLELHQGRWTRHGNLMYCFVGVENGSVGILALKSAPQSVRVRRKKRRFDKNCPPGID